ncbi:helix-turn-helix domain-containing protein [Maritimibacter sp. DP07]|uniref:Helix-turn-helix domain-containing protein n=1 Tax=Maritimibacter harenae TaxID=2606218 RepID=A0A845M3M6_9RHOB|nr:helix-turn-helix domain-containing protein [Maritimibacter harenae]MZR14166.1 helix-turn-helix domain-containing protein [Maritimibacter harenae]
MDDNWYSDENATFGDRLAAARDAVGLSQKDLAKKLGVKVKTLAAWENDVSEPRANRLQMLSGLLSVSLRWLLTGEGEGVDPPGAGNELTRDAKALLMELREVQSDITDATKRMARLEKGLRKLLEEAPT